MNDATMYAKYNQAGNKTVYAILDGMSNDEREMDRGSFCKSLSGLVRHIAGVNLYFLDMFKTTLSGNAKAIEALSNLPPEPPDGTLNNEQWKELGKNLEASDTAYIAMTEALSENDLQLPVSINWFGGNPAHLPLSFMLSQLTVHNTHHRGQISQILDSLKIEHDYSGIDLAFM